MNLNELKAARVRHGFTGKESADALGLTVDGYFKKEYGAASISLNNAYKLTRLYGLSLEEFVKIFFDGELPFLQTSVRNCDYRTEEYPLRTARLVAKVSEEEAAKAIGVTPEALIDKEKGRLRITLEQCAELSRLYGLSFDEFNEIFFRSCLPFSNDDVIAYNHIMD